MGWIKEHRFALTLGLTCTIAAIVGFIIFRFPGTWAFHPQETTSLSAVDFQKFQYAASSCPSKQSFRLDFDGSGRPLDISMHACDKEAKDAPQWLKESGLISHPEFVIAVRKEWLSKKIVGGQYSEDGYSEITTGRFQNRDVLFLVTTRQGSGGYVDWCVFGSTRSLVGCIPEPSDEEFRQELAKDLRPDETVSSWNPEYSDDELTLTSVVYGPHDGYCCPNCCPTRGGISLKLKPVNGQLKINGHFRFGKPLDSEALEQFMTVLAAKINGNVVYEPMFDVWGADSDFRHEDCSIVWKERVDTISKPNPHVFSYGADLTRFTTDVDVQFYPVPKYWIVTAHAKKGERAATEVVEDVSNTDDSFGLTFMSRQDADIVATALRQAIDVCQ